MTPSQRKNLNRFFILISLFFITSTALAYNTTSTLSVFYHDPLTIEQEMSLEAVRASSLQTAIDNDKNTIDGYNEDILSLQDSKKLKPNDPKRPESWFSNPWYRVYLNNDEIAEEINTLDEKIKALKTKTTSWGKAKEQSDSNLIALGKQKQQEDDDQEFITYETAYLQIFAYGQGESDNQQGVDFLTLDLEKLEKPSGKLPTSDITIRKAERRIRKADVIKKILNDILTNPAKYKITKSARTQLNKLQSELSNKIKPSLDIALKAEQNTQKAAKERHKKIAKLYDQVEILHNKQISSTERVRDAKKYQVLLEQYLKANKKHTNTESEKVLISAVEHNIKTMIDHFGPQAASEKNNYLQAQLIIARLEGGDVSSEDRERLKGILGETTYELLAANLKENLTSCGALLDVINGQCINEHKTSIVGGSAVVTPPAPETTLWSSVEKDFGERIKGLQEEFDKEKAKALATAIDEFIASNTNQKGDYVGKPKDETKARDLLRAVEEAQKESGFGALSTELIARVFPELDSKVETEVVVSAVDLLKNDLEEMEAKLKGCKAAALKNPGECLRDDGSTPYEAELIPEIVDQLTDAIKKLEEGIASLELRCTESKNEFFVKEKEKVDALNASSEEHSTVEQNRIENLAKLASQKDRLEDALNAQQIRYQKNIDKILSNLEKLPLEKKRAIRKLNDLITAQNITLNNLENEKQQAYSARQSSYTSMYEHCKNEAEGLVKAEIQQVADKISRGTYKVKSAANFHTQSWAKIKRHYESKYKRKTLECFQNNSGLKSVAGITSDTVINSKKSASIRIEADLKRALDQKDRLIEIANLGIEKAKKQLKDIPETIDNRIKDLKRSQDLLTNEHNAKMNSLRTQISRIDQQLMQQTLNQHTQVASINRTIQSALSFDPVIKGKFEIAKEFCSANDPFLVEFNPEKTDQIDNSFQEGIAQGVAI